MKKAVIIGMGVSGKAVSAFFKKKGIDCLGIDKEDSYFEELAILSEQRCPAFENVDLIVKSPGIAFTHPWVQAGLEKNIPIVGEIDLALAEIKNKKILAITGSNGKTTTTLFTEHLLKTAGERVLAVGNVGASLLSHIDSEVEVFVLELSSFQLEKIILGPFFERAALLNLTANHLDRHRTLEEYMRAKLNIQKCIKKGGIFFTTKEILQTYGLSGEIFEIYKEKVETFSSLGYRDRERKILSHDVENYAAAFALAGVSDEVLERALATFQKPPHRLEHVKMMNGVAFINDSKATSLDAVIKAVDCLEGKIMLIAGGVHKGGSFRQWLPFFRNKVEKIFALGKAREEIVSELSEAIPTEKVESLEEGVHKAFQEAVEGYTVLLSPGCASYDQFANYEQRGEKFKEIVRELGDTK